MNPLTLVLTLPFDRYSTIKSNLRASRQKVKMLFPHADPIPIPAPIWLMKVLSLLTLALHFFAVQILIGSLIAAIYFSFKGKGSQGNAAQGAAMVVSRRLPIVMTYVINLGVPPLLFAQVLYGRALYTSSVLIAVQWIGVVFLVMGCYWLLYRMSDLSMKGRPIHWHGIGALLLAAFVGHIYSANMTLMLRPEVWQQMYANTATGLQQAPHDPTADPRLLYVLMGGFLVGGLWLVLHSKVKSVSEEVGAVLKSTGALMAIIGGGGELLTGYMAYSAQPANVLAGLHTPLYQISSAVWGVGFLLALLASVLLFVQKTSGVLMTIVGSLGAFLGIAGSVIVRDGIRDVTLLGKGFNVWDRREASNWFVIILFVLLFVAGLVAIGWLLSVMKSAKPIPEQVNS